MVEACEPTGSAASFWLNWLHRRSMPTGYTVPATKMDSGGDKRKPVSDQVITVLLCWCRGPTYSGGVISSDERLKK